MAENVVPITSARQLEIRSKSDIDQAQHAVESLAQAAGFPLVTVAKLQEAVTELARHLFEKTSHSALALKLVCEPEQQGIEAISCIPTLLHPAKAEASTPTGLVHVGKQLSEASRIMDEVEVTNVYPGTSRIVWRKWARPTTDIQTHRLHAGIITRPLQVMNGDMAFVKRWSQYALFGLIDGLGHGEPAYQAALAARDYIAAHHELPIGRIFRGAATACRGTRGVVMAIARIDQKSGTISAASVGNVEVRVHPSGLTSHLPARRGILGLNAPAAMVIDLPWQQDTALVMHSDGLHSRWSWKDFPDLEHRPAIAIAEELFLKQAKPQDDATVMVVRNESE